jgi:hypothetical protein
MPFKAAQLTSVLASYFPKAALPLSAKLRLGTPSVGRGMVIDRLESGKIKETKILMDTLGLMRQM